MVRCRLCNQELGRITHTHLWHKHRRPYRKFIKQFPGANAGVISWNKGKSKENHPSLLKLSQRLKAAKEWNLSDWQRKRRLQYADRYRELEKDKNLAELIGIVLGDGNLHKHLRTENLRITCNSKDTGYINHIGNLIKKIFRKSPSIRKRNDVNAVSVDLYQCKISERLNLPCGDKIKNNVGIPHWILSDKRYILICLKGLFETDGCFHVDTNNYTYIIEFKNNCKKLRADVYRSLVKLDFSPQCGHNYIRLAKRGEVYRFKEIINFRNYFCPLVQW